ncbi:YibE/F family protein [Fictibacillus fluitans]|uniref:YibE/F family protein n=1 Tax=Fictibacillus fluitans TaxID=3058422 RepID=A0ABT8HQL1_9BACL|nr:YibE/F family protein [Fictibacillus sp. NE201]MDN4523064.1 YibE/F family protein [Fictibacillus sp. NE201]
MNVIVNKYKGLTSKSILLYTVIVICFVSSILFVNHNSTFYKQTVAKVTNIHLQEKKQVKDMHNNEDQIFTQSITAEIKNGKYKGKLVRLTNDYSSSGAYDQQYKIGNELFISIDKNSKKQKLTGSINDAKRDKYLVLVGWIFILTLLLVGKKRGLFSLISLLVNALLLSFALDFYVNHSYKSLVWICSILVILFTVISLLLLNGLNEMTYAAIVATLLGIFLTLLVTYVSIKFTAGNGLRYEEMQFLTRPYELVFMAGLLVGSLGAVMDVAITISSSVFGLYEKNGDISLKALKQSGMEIGKDVMGALTNILFFVYAAGSIPSMILYLKNASSLGFTLSMNLSLEIARSLAGGIGIMLTIPIAVYTSVYFVNQKRKRI